MVCLFQWSRVTTVGIYLLAFLVLLTESTKNTSIKKELRIRNKREGSWSAWSPYTTCSRTCGGGIRTQTRHCRTMRSREKSKEFIDEFKMWKNASSRHCEGHSTRHHLCNSQPCPAGTPGIRESQCKLFDNRPFMGKVYQWEAFIDERNPCSLTCRAIGFRFFTTLNKSVIDGTPCQQTVGEGSSWFDLHVCISGSCTSIGCDGIAGSQRRLDRCGVCGGDNSTCQVVSGIFTRPQLPVGYNMVAHIPRGACNLNITQIRKSPNYLALRKYDGSYILNGNWAISWPGDYEAAGSTFHYKRQDLKSFESIAASGPLHEPIDLLVLYQQPNPGIKYEYMMPMNDAPVPPVPGIPDSGPLVNQHHRQHSAATSRPSSFIPLSPSVSNNNPPSNLLLNNNKNNPVNTISSFPSSPGQNVYGGTGDSSYSHSHKPEQTHPHLHGHEGRRSGNKLGGGPISDKKFQWKMMGYANCTEPCGGGTQTSVVRCIRVSTGAPVPDRRCHGEDKSPIQTTIRCNLKPCPAEWTVGPFSDCTELCGQGFQSRTVHCQQRISPTLTMRVSEQACLDSQPESRKSCFIKPCHRWETSAFSQCSAPCGNGIRSRNVMCLNAEGEKIPLEDCDSKDKPLDISPCNMGPCEGGADWFVSAWSNECSEKCGSGLQTRHVICSGLHEKSRKRAERVSSELETNLVDDDDNEDNFLPGKEESSVCDESQRPAEEKECFSERQCAEAVWFEGPWSECLVSCGNGLKTRQVLCVLFSRGKFKVVDDSLCSRLDKPDEKNRCESARLCSPRWFATEWTECSATCGGGVQKRSISCRSSNWTSPSSKCFDSDRPLDRQSCNEHKCDQRESIPPGNLQSENRSARQPITRLSTTDTQLAATKTETSQPNLQEPNEEPDETECTDQYRNCALVVQARLCRYKYYRSVCCISCTVN